MVVVRCAARNEHVHVERLREDRIDAVEPNVQTQLVPRRRVGRKGDLEPVAVSGSDELRDPDTACA
jgi:hypothetical protein